MSFIDLFSDKADLYALARPTYPDDLFRFIASIAPGGEHAWDCGTGNGQAAIGLARYFRNVEATDASEQQISNGLPCASVRYTVQPAENTDFGPSSFDAVCAATALHWFDLERFYPEVKRVLKDRGVFVAWGYNWLHVSAGFDSQFKRSIRDVIETYWPPQNVLLMNGYRDVPFPFKRVETPRFDMEMQWTFPQLMAYIGTWSAVQNYLKEKGPQSLDRAVMALAPAWGDGKRARAITMHLHVLADRYERPLK